MTDEDLGVALLSSTPTHENRDPDLLRSWARTALAFGDEIAVDGLDPDLVVEEKTGGLGGGQVVLAEYHRRTHVVTVYTDSLARMRAVTGLDDSEADALRTAAIAHEVAHHRLHGPLARELRVRLDHTAVRIGRLRVRGHVAGADELVAHRYAHRVSGLRRSPLLLTAVLAESLGTQGA